MNNLFEKYHNYKLQELLELKQGAVRPRTSKTKEKIWLDHLLTFNESGPFSITNAEKSWLKYQLSQDKFIPMLTAETRDKLEEWLQDTKSTEYSIFITEKAHPGEKMVQDDKFLNLCRKIIQLQKGMRISFVIRDGKQYEGISGIPYQLQFSMSKHKWYLLWLPVKNEEARIMSTPLCNVLEIEMCNIVGYDNYIEEIEMQINNNKKWVTIQFSAKDFPDEEDRILFAFSCFEKNVKYNEQEETYDITLWYQQDERGYILQKIRFLGRRVKIIAPDNMRQRMLETCQGALKKYNQ